MADLSIQSSLEELNKVKQKLHRIAETAPPIATSSRVDGRATPSERSKAESVTSGYRSGHSLHSPACVSDDKSDGSHGQRHVPQRADKGGYQGKSALSPAQEIMSLLTSVRPRDPPETFLTQERFIPLLLKEYSDEVHKQKTREADLKRELKIVMDKLNAAESQLKAEKERMKKKRSADTSREKEREPPPYPYGHIVPYLGTQQVLPGMPNGMWSHGTPAAGVAPGGATPMQSIDPSMLSLMMKIMSMLDDGTKKEKKKKKSKKMRREDSSGSATDKESGSSMQLRKRPHGQEIPSVPTFSIPQPLPSSHVCPDDVPQTKQYSAPAGPRLPEDATEKISVVAPVSGMPSTGLLIPDTAERHSVSEVLERLQPACAPQLPLPEYTSEEDSCRFYICTLKGEEVCTMMKYLTTMLDLVISMEGIYFPYYHLIGNKNEICSKIVINKPEWRHRYLCIELLKHGRLNECIRMPSVVKGQCLCDIVTYCCNEGMLPSNCRLNVDFIQKKKKKEYCKKAIVKFEGGWKLRTWNVLLQHIADIKFIRQSEHKEVIGEANMLDGVVDVFSGILTSQWGRVDKQRFSTSKVRDFLIGCVSESGKKDKKKNKDSDSSSASSSSSSSTPKKKSKKKKAEEPKVEEPKEEKKPEPAPRATGYGRFGGGGRGRGRFNFSSILGGGNDDPFF